MAIRLPDKITLIKLALAVILLAAIVHFVDADRILEAASSANGWFILAGILLLPANLLLENLLWHRLVSNAAPDISFGRAFGSLLFGHSLGLFTPARAGEFVGRPLYLGLPDKWQAGLMVAAHRISDLTSVVLMGTLSLIFFGLYVDVPFSGVWLAFTLTGVALCILMPAVLLFPDRTYRWLSRAIKSDRVRRHFTFLRLLNTRTSASLLSLSWLRYLVYTSQFLIFLYAFAPQAPAFIAYAAVALVMFAKFIIPPVTFTDLGIREGASVFFFGLIAVDAASAFNASILIYFTNFLLPSCLGLPFVVGMRAGSHTSPSALPHSGSGTGDLPERIGARTSPPHLSGEFDTADALVMSTAQVVRDEKQ